MQGDDAEQQKPSKRAPANDESTELDDGQLAAVHGGTAISANRKLLSTKKPADSGKAQAATMTAIALAESGGSD